MLRSSVNAWKAASDCNAVGGSTGVSLTKELATATPKPLKASATNLTPDERGGLC
jgi:hypothetical protein